MNSDGRKSTKIMDGFPIKVCFEKRFKGDADSADMMGKSH